MTITIKLDISLEERLRQRAASAGRSNSDIVRAALRSFLDQSDPEPARSAHDLGHEFFGRHRGAADLAQNRKGGLADVVAARHVRRSR